MINTKYELWLFYISVICLFFLYGSNVLISLGFSSSGEEIIYPFTYLICIMFILSNVKQHLNYKYEMYIICFILGVICFNKFTGRDAGIIAVQSIIVPPIFSILMKEVKEIINWRFVYTIVMIFYIANCLLSIVERLTYHCVFPDLGFETGFNIGQEGFRSYALYGHPLSNASITSLIMSFFLISPYKHNRKLIFWCLGLIALLCFNARFCLVISIFQFLLFYIKELFFTRRVRMTKKIFHILGLVVICFISVKLITLGFGDRLVTMGLYDEGSASVRIDILQIFANKTWQDFLFGISSHEVAFLAYSQGLDGYIIENCWILFIFMYGIIFMAVLILLYIKLIWRTAHNYSIYSKLFILIPWLAVISSSNSLATGSLAIINLILLFNIYDPKNHSLLLVKR